MPHVKLLNLYFDTSVFNFALANDAPKEREITHSLIKEAKQGKFDVFISEVVLREINGASALKARQLIEIVDSIDASILEVSQPILELAESYVAAKIIPQKYFDDALHIAVAASNNMDAIVSWNFKHIVKLKTKREVSGINLMAGYKEIEICSPLEVVSL